MRRRRAARGRAGGGEERHGCRLPGSRAQPHRAAASTPDGAAAWRGAAAQACSTGAKQGRGRADGAAAPSSKQSKQKQ
uniref:Uncharacterized protein n=1 Tax=Oryza meridionalis TaxID=40149 RepID=A0A0E0EMW2_9ORYZ